jgi:hypothetical protein
MSTHTENKNISLWCTVFPSKVTVFTGAFTMNRFRCYLFRSGTTAASAGGDTVSVFMVFFER